MKTKNKAVWNPNSIDFSNTFKVLLWGNKYEQNVGILYMKIISSMKKRNLVWIISWLKITLLILNPSFDSSSDILMEGRDCIGIGATWFLDFLDFLNLSSAVLMMYRDATTMVKMAKYIPMSKDLQKKMVKSRTVKIFHTVNNVHVLTVFSPFGCTAHQIFELLLLQKGHSSKCFAKKIS